MVIKDRIVVLVLLGISGIWGAIWLSARWEAGQKRTIYEEIVRPLMNVDYNEEGIWVGDVAELHRMGRISRELGEADTAPLNPLVPKPMPIHGYYVRMMESGPAGFSDQPPETLKGQKRNKNTFAILIYPAEPSEGKHTWLLTRIGLFRRSDAWTPVFRFPTDQERVAQWGIVD